ncbi:MAG: hypothetical protein K5871_05775 [Lachnospiraceae bacterium]|nr:hypothetical protein [Lachnospiraceae bacterium]
MKKLSVLLITGLTIALTACGTASEQPAPETSEVVEDTTENTVEDTVQEPEADPVAETEAPSEESLINDFREAQDLWFRFEGGFDSDYDDTVMGEISGYAAEFYRVTEPGISSLQDLEDYLSARVDREYVAEAMSKTEMYMESDGSLYACPAGRGDDLSIGWVEFAAETNGTTGNVIVTIHRMDYYLALQDFYESGEVNVYEYPFTIVDGHAMFDSMNYLCGSYPAEAPIDGYDVAALETALMEAVEGTWFDEDGSSYYEILADGTFTYYADGEALYSGYIVASGDDGGSYMMNGDDFNGTVFVMDLDQAGIPIILFDDGGTVFTKGEG